jgi:predicted O-methyltransferase YrrM
MDATVRAVIDRLESRISQEREGMGRGNFDRDKMALAAGPDSASLLNLLIRTKGAHRIVEVGTSIGYTALWLGEAAKAVGGHVIGMEYIADKHAQAIQNLKDAGLSDVVEVRQGDAKAILRDIKSPIDLAFVDAWKDDYIHYFDDLLPKMSLGGVIVADNITRPESSAELMKAYQAHVRGKPNVRSTFLSIGSGLEMSVRTA